MATVKVLSIASAVVGLLLLGSIIGYSGEDLIPEVPKPDAGMCGVTKEAYTDVPGSGAFVDIDVEITWSDNTVWIGIIDVQTYESLQKLGGNSEGEIDLVTVTSHMLLVAHQLATQNFVATRW